MKVIITGATGMVGKGVLLECLEHENITEILSIIQEKCWNVSPETQRTTSPGFFRI